MHVTILQYKKYLVLIYKEILEWENGKYQAKYLPFLHDNIARIKTEAFIFCSQNNN